MFGTLAKGKILHGKIITGGETLVRRQDQFLAKIIAVYAAAGATLQARRLLEDALAEQSTAFFFNALIRAHLLHRLPLDALSMFRRMISARRKPDNFTFTFAVKACADLELRRGGEQLHCAALAAGFPSDGYVQNSLIAMYANCGALYQARKVFDGMLERTIVSWNTMIAGLSRNGRAVEAATLFDEMMKTSCGNTADSATLVAVLPACAALKDLSRGSLVHRLARERGFLVNIAVKNALIDMYAKNGSLEDARKVFDEKTGSRDVISWTAMMAGYALHSQPHEAFSLYPAMLRSGAKPNSVTIISLLTACDGIPYLPHGRALHSSALRRDISSEVQVETALIDMYGRCSGSAGLSHAVFSAGSKKTVTWNAMISSFTRNGFPREAVELLLKMRKESAGVDEATFAALLPACSVLADPIQALNLHGYLVKIGFDRTRDLATGLIDLHVKVGDLESARKLFEDMTERDTIAWSAIINGYAVHGRGREAVVAFGQMMEEGIQPNEVTYSVLLTSLSHAGLVDVGLDLARVTPGSVRSYAGVVDLLGRAGRLEEAHALAATVEGNGSAAMWGALLGACVVHGQVQIGEEAAKRLFELEPENTGNYVLLGNIYAAAGKWEEAEEVRKMMTNRGLTKLSGYSISTNS